MSLHIISGLGTTETLDVMVATVHTYIASYIMINALGHAGNMHLASVY